MSPAIILPPLQAILDLHRMSIERFGGSHGVRDADGAAAALARAAQVLAYAESEQSVTQVAAAIGFSLCKIRHPFVDGNERAAWFTMFVTMRLNGFYLDARESEATAMVLGVAEGSRSEAELAAFLDVNTAPA